MPEVTRIVWTDSGVQVRRSGRNEKADACEIRQGLKGFSVKVKVKNEEIELKKSENKPVEEKKKVVSEIAKA